MHSAETTPRRGRSEVLRRAEYGVGLLFTIGLIGLHFSVLRHAGALWRDEIQSVNLVQRNSLWTMLEQNLVDSFPVLWSLVLRGWVTLGFGETDLALRGLGFVIGLAIIAMLWWNGARLGHGVPLISLLLFALSPTVFRYGDGVRGYGLGALLLLFMLSAVWTMVERPTRTRIAIAAAAALLAVHSVYSNSVLLLALCLGGAGVAIWRRAWRTLGALGAIGFVSVLSMLPYLRTIESHREWSAIVHRPIDTLWILERFGRAVEPSGAFVVWLWPALLALAIAACGYRLTRRAPEEPRAERDLALYLTVMMIAWPLFYLLYLRSLSMQTQAWYYIPVMAVLAVSFDAAFQLVVRSNATARMVRLGVVVALGGLIFFNARPMAEVRMTNVDRIAAWLEKESARDDLIVVNPFCVGVTFNRYYSGDTPWMTLPEFEERYFQPYPLFKERMATARPIASELKRITRTLRSGGRVWLVGGLWFLEPGELPGNLPPAPFAAVGWNEKAYRDVWSRQAAYVVHTQARRLALVELEPDGPVTALGDLPLFVADGRPAENGSPREAP